MKNSFASFLGQDGLLREYCSSETFEADCGEDYVVQMTEARFGRMRLGRCVKRDFGFLGCYEDVLNFLHERYHLQRTANSGVHDLLTSKQTIPTHKTDRSSAQVAPFQHLLHDKVCKAEFSVPVSSTLSVPFHEVLSLISERTSDTSPHRLVGPWSQTGGGQIHHTDWWGRGARLVGARFTTPTGGTDPPHQLDQIHHTDWLAQSTKPTVGATNDTVQPHEGCCSFY